MVLKRRHAEDLQRLGHSVDRLGDAVKDLAEASPPAERAQTEHPEIARLVGDFDRASAIVEAAAQRRYMTASEYGRVAGRFQAIAKAMKAGAARESAAEKRRKSPARRRTKTST